MEGATGRKRVPIHVVKNLNFPFPPLEEQKKIAEVLSQMRQSIEIQNQLITVTTELSSLQ